MLICLFKIKNGSVCSIVTVKKPALMFLIVLSESP